MQLQSFSTNPGIYIFLGKNKKILYVGKAKNLKNRISSYFRSITELGPKTKVMVSQVEKIKTQEVTSEIEALLLEANLIKKYSPKYNVRLTDGKAYPLIRITIKDKYPKVLIARRIDDKKSLYFGPYPNSGALRLVLKTIRRIFPFQSVKNHPKKLCLYYHLNLCPCPEVLEDKEYRKNINHIITFLKGRKGKVLKDLEKERNSLVKLEEFEKASLIQKKINAILLVTSPVYEKFDYKFNINLDEDQRLKELLDLKSILIKNSVKISNLKRIECFDISNISGTSATGSMVVFVNGEKDPSMYRKFKIRTVDKIPNDFAMISEIIRRRLNHAEWSYPNLIIVDGGKGQVSAVLSAIRTMKHPVNETIDIPVIGLAKKEETIITSTFKEILLPKDSPALHFIMRIRDEAHRFAITYHKKLRSKKFLI